MSLATILTSFATRVGAEAKSLRTLINGNASTLGALSTTAKNNLVAAINEVNAKSAFGAKGGRFYCNGLPSNPGISGAGSVLVPLNSTEFNDDTGTMTLASSGVKAVVDGLYLIVFYGYIVTSNNGVFTLYVQKDTTTIQESSVAMNNTAVRITGSVVTRLTANQIVTLVMYGTVGAYVAASAAKDAGIELVRLGN